MSTTLSGGTLRVFYLFIYFFFFGGGDNLSGGFVALSLLSLSVKLTDHVKLIEFGLKRTHSIMLFEYQ